MEGSNGARSVTGCMLAVLRWLFGTVSWMAAEFHRQPVLSMSVLEVILFNEVQEAWRLWDTQCLPLPVLFLAARGYCGAGVRLHGHLHEAYLQRPRLGVGTLGAWAPQEFKR